MSETAAAPPTPADPKPTHTKNPCYAVFRECEVDEPIGTYQLVNEQVEAPSRKEAIVRATAKGEEASKSGTFLVVPSQQVQRIKRKMATQVVDEFA